MTGDGVGGGRASLAHRSTELVHFLAGDGLDWLGHPCMSGVASMLDCSQVGVGDSGNCVC